MKTNLLKSIFISLILLVGATNAWAANGTITVYFKNTVNWSNVYVYFLTSSYWNEAKGCGSYGYTAKQMTYDNTLKLYKCTYTGNYSEYITFTKDKQDNYGNFWQTEAVYRNDFSTTSPIFVPSNTSNETKNSTKYYNDGSWVATTTQTVHYIGTLSTPYAYIWNSNNGNHSAWPGEKMTDSGKTYEGKVIYTITTPYTFKNLIFSNNGNNQTSDLTLEADKIYDHNNNKWISYNYDVTITFNSNGKGNNPASKTVLKGNTITAPTAPSVTGYSVEGWYKEQACTNKWNFSTAVDADMTLFAKWTPNTYNITYKDQGNVTFSGTHAAGAPTKHTYGTATTLKTATKTGYTFGGWFTNSGCTGSAVTSLGETAYTANITLYAKWTANTYTVTLDQEGAAVKGDTEAEATYDAALPKLKQVPTAQNGYAFMGYWDAKNGAGKQYYNADGTSAANWDKAANATLYAYFKKAEISEITLNQAIFDPVPAGGNGSVTATVAPKPVGDVVICWQLLYSNGDPIADHDPAVDGNSATFSIAGLETGHYIIRATLRTGTSCNSGTVLHTLDQNFTIAANFTVTVRYTCDGKTIAAPTKHTGHATNPTEITAQEIGGYDFKEWVLGDGIYSTSTLTEKTIEYTATYDGYLTATYQKKKLIFLDVSKLPNKAKWTAPHIYLYKAGGYWNDSNGAGSGKHDGTSLIIDAAMTPVPGTTDIWYYEYANAADFGGVVAFTSVAQVNYGNFHGCEAIYRSDFTSGTPMFIPSTEQEPEKKNGNATSYYSKGHWTKYMDGTGYTLKVYDQKAEGRKEILSVPFVSSSYYLPFTAVAELESEKTYGYKLLRDDDKWYHNDNNGTMTYSSHTNWPFILEEKNEEACGITTTSTGDYTFTLRLNSSTGNLEISVDYPIKTGDYRLAYTDNTPTPNPFHPGHTIKKGDGLDTVSFFIHYDKEPKILLQQCSVNNSGKVTWTTKATYNVLKTNGADPTSAQLPGKRKSDAVLYAGEGCGIETSGVYNFILKQSGNDAELATDLTHEYAGNFYIRVDAADGKWYDYKTNPDNLMTYSAFSESEANSFGDKFSHYKTKWCPRGTNVKFVIANDYSLCISDTLARDLVRASGEDYMDEGGNLYQDGGANDPVYDRYSANIRFMWNRKNNKISRAYLASSSNDSRQFLVLKGCQEIKDENGNNLSGKGDNHGEHRALLQDTQDWIYERTFMVKPGTRVKLYACYADATVSPATAQYFRGKYDSNQCGSTENSVQILGGNGTDWEKIRVIYDFKTNRLIGAWVPSGEISETQTIAADVMIMRNHQEDATCITLAEGKSLNSVKTVYGALRFNRWTLNNKDANTHLALSIEDQKTIYERALFFISFPFDVHLSDAFGLGTYGTHWVISTYNGKRRAERGYFAEDCINEDCTNWDYIWDPTDFVMEANVGYLLSLDLELMKDDDNSFWPNNINYRELFFPSQVELETITKTNYTMPELGSEYECTINLNTDGTQPERDRRVKDSYWRCIGVPSFADYSGLLKDGSNESITWQPAGGNLPFLYEWNVTNNNLVVRSATNYRFRPTFAYLIQNGSEINWTLVSTKPNPIIARDQTENVSNYEWKIALLRNGNTEDQTFVRVTDDETVTAAFDFNQDLSKEFNYGANIYTLAGYERLAANSLPMNDSTTIIPLGVSAQEAGDYTITMPEGVESVGVTLVDAETGTHTNLSAGMEYTFTLNRGTYDGRLYLEISPIEKTPTDLEYVDEATRNQNIRKFIIDGKLYLQKDGMLYDAQGHIVR